MAQTCREINNVKLVTIERQFGEVHKLKIQIEFDHVDIEYAFRNNEEALLTILATDRWLEKDTRAKLITLGTLADLVERVEAKAFQAHIGNPHPKGE